MIYVQNMYAKVERHYRKLIQVNTKEYDMKLHQVNMTRVTCTAIQLKLSKTLISHTSDVGISNKYVMQL